MSNEWMIDVLKDLRGFAASNGLMALAEQIDDAIHLAISDAQIPAGSSKDAAGATETRGLHRTHASGANA